MKKKKRKKIIKVNYDKDLEYFTKDSSIVGSWVSLILAGAYTYEQVPNLYNLRKIVKEILDELKGGKKEEPTIEVSD